MNVGTILEGSVRTVDNNIRITTNLIDADKGHTLWSANYDRKLNNIFQVQDEIARAVVKALQAQLLESEERPVDRVVVTEPYTAYQQGNYLQGKLTVEDQNAAITYFQQARIQLARGDIAAAKEANALEAHPVWKNIGTGVIACSEGDKETGIGITNELIEQREIFNAEEIYYLCGEEDKVFTLIQAAAEDRDPALTEMKLSWAMTPLRSDPRWIEILTLMGFAE